MLSRDLKLVIMWTFLCKNHATLNSECIKLFSSSFQIFLKQHSLACFAYTRNVFLCRRPRRFSVLTLFLWFDVFARTLSKIFLLVTLFLLLQPLANFPFPLTTICVFIDHNNGQLLYPMLTIVRSVGCWQLTVYLLFYTVWLFQIEIVLVVWPVLSQLATSWNLSFHIKSIVLLILYYYLQRHFLLLEALSEPF